MSGSQAIRTQLILIGTMAIWGLNVSVIKVLAANVHPMLVATLRMVIAAIVINLTLWLLRPPIIQGRIPLAQCLRFVLCAALMVYANQIFFARGMVSASATNSALILALSPLVASLMAAVIFREKLSRVRLLGVALGFGGVFVVVIMGADASLAQASQGDALVFGAMVSFVAGGVFIQSLARQYHALFISSVIYTVGSVMLGIHTLLDDSVVLNEQTLLGPGLRIWAFMAFAGIVPTAVCNMLWNKAIAELGVARTSVYQYWIPVFGVIFALVWLDEPFTLWHVAGMAGILLGTYLGTRRA